MSEESFFDKMQKLADNACDVLGENIDLETVPENGLGVIVDALSAFTQTDKFILEQAGYNKGELVSLFTQVSEIHNEIIESTQAIEDATGFNSSELVNGTYKDAETCKLRHSAARDAMNRLSTSIRERAQLKMQLKALSANTPV